MDLELGLKSTILEALIEKITNVQNKTTNNAAVEAFTKIITDEPEYARTAVQLITTKIQSPYEWEALQALYLLESCMSTSSMIQAEVGKFRFLNELIKLVSPKYLGDSTSAVIKNRITSLLKAWCEKYSEETKIREAFDMLIKQGVVVEDSYKRDTCRVSSNAAVSSSVKPSLYEEDEEKSRLLQKLLRSNKPNDLKAANHLIKTMVKEKEKKEDLRLIRNNTKLLSEMLSNASSNTSSEDIELMKELKETCVNMKPTVAFLISSCNKTAKDAAQLFELNDLLNDTLQLFYETMIEIRKPSITNLERCTVNVQSTPSTLLDFSSPIDDIPLLQTSINSSTFKDIDLFSGAKEKSEVSTLEEIFNSVCSIAEVSKNVGASLYAKAESNCSSSSSTKLFQDLCVLEKSLLDSDTHSDEISNCVSKLNDLTSQSQEKFHQPQESINHDDFLLCDDDELINISDQRVPACDTSINNLSSRKSCEMTNTDAQPEQITVKPLTDICVPLMEIKTDGDGKILAFEDAVGINVSIQLTKNKPRNDISVFLVLSCSQKNVAISNFLFQPVVPKECRLKLQSPSKCDLPPFNPHIPVETIVQVMLIASFKKDYIPLRFVISYTEKDEMITEMGEVTALPLR